MANPDDFAFKIFSFCVALLLAGIIAWLLFLYLQWERLALASAVVAALAGCGIVLSVLGNVMQRNPPSN